MLGFVLCLSANRTISFTGCKKRADTYGTKISPLHFGITWQLRALKIHEPHQCIYTPCYLVK